MSDNLNEETKIITDELINDAKDESIIVESTPSADVKEVVISDEIIRVDEEKKFLRNNRGANLRNNTRRAHIVKEKPEFDSKTIDIRRVTRVTSGGRRFSLSVAIVIGDKNGRIGFGTGKALDTQLAIEKATKAARKNMFTIKLSKNKSIPHDLKAKYKSAKIWITPNNGKGIIAGSSARSILALAGINNVTAKFNSGTKNKINNARVTMKALQFFSR